MKKFTNSLVNKALSCFFLAKDDFKFLAIISTLVAFFDLLTKYLVFSINITGYYICPVLNILKVRNYGISFGLFSEQPYITIFFIIIFDLAIIAYLLHCLQTKNMYRRPIFFVTAVCFVIGGAIGNLFDRFYYGSVRDFIDFHWKNYHWPCFNVADVFICIGVGMLIVCELFYKKKEAKK